VPFLAPDVYNGRMTKAPRNDLTQAQVRELFDYDPSAGHLIWKIERYRKHPGDIAGCDHFRRNGYKTVTVSINYKRYLAHRIIWLWVTGKWPVEEIDHKDGDGSNNRWSNLREATKLQNGSNLPIKRNNKTGVAGVAVDKRRGDYRARIMVNRKEIYLGNFPTIKEAAEARRLAEQKYFGEYIRYA
jgi:hypothetical protein